MEKKGVYLTWQNVSASVKDKQILHKITGVVTPGSSLAIMGPSGAGKTTLLSILAKKYGASLNVSGDVLANGEQYSASSFYAFASFVYQNDILNEALTVRETLQFSAKLKIKNSIEASERVEELLNSFLLKKCQNTKVGGKFIKGISGGEKKRLCIAIEIMCKPDLLILDEPTSGLDSYMANSVINILNKLSKDDNKTILYTIHQPSYKIYSGINNLLLLDRGNCIYQGPASGIHEYMMKLQIQIPPKTTICDFFMLEISEFKERTQSYVTPLNAENYGKILEPRIKEQVGALMKENDFPAIEKRVVSQSYWNQFLLLFSRELILFSRNPMKMGRAIGNAFLMIIIVGVIFMSVISKDRPDPKKTYDQFSLMYYFIEAQGVSFICITSTIMTGIFSVSLVFPVERQVFTKQVSSKTYNAFPYFISKLIIEVITLWIAIFIFTSGSYWLIGYKYTFLEFVKFCFTLIAVASVGSSIGLLTGSFFKDAQKASAMAPAFLLPLMMFSGLYNQLSSIPVWIRWLQYISPFRYGLHAVLLNEFGSQTYNEFGGGSYNYREQFSIRQTWGENVGIIFALAFLYYSLAFISLRGLKANLSA